MIDQLYADTLLELDKALAGLNDAYVVAEELLRQRDEALQLAHDLSGSLQAALEFFNHWDGVPMWAGLSNAQDALIKSNQLLK